MESFDLERDTSFDKNMDTKIIYPYKEMKINKFLSLVDREIKPENMTEE